MLFNMWHPLDSLREQAAEELEQWAEEEVPR
jgi:hypothetical protein